MTRKRIEQSLITLFSFIVCLFFGLIATSQILGFFKIFKPWLSIPLGLIITAASFIFLVRLKGLHFLYAFFHWEEQEPKTREILPVGLYCAGILIVLLLVLIPLARWPYSPVDDTLTWDAGAYQLPKAVEMYKTGSIWDMSISYADYPFGYEAMLAWTLSVSGSEILFGSVHALVAIFLLLSLWLLAVRYTKISPALLFFTTILLLFSGILDISSNIWWVLKYLIYTIGKSDLFIGGAILSAIVFAPIGPRSNQKQFHFFGLGLASMIVMSNKPNGFLIVGFAWLLVLMEWLRQTRGKGAKAFPWLSLLLSIFLMFPGLTWLVRNLIATGQIFSEHSLLIQLRSITNNLTNPNFYNHIEFAVYEILVIFVLSIVFLFIQKEMSWTIVVAHAIFIYSFAAFGESAFAASIQVPAEISWRLGVYMLCFTFLVALVIINPVIVLVYRWVVSSKVLPAFALSLALGISAALIWNLRDSLQYNPKGIRTIQDQFAVAVGEDGYFSAYDFVRKNIRNSIVYVENGLPYFVLGPGFTNTVSRQNPADYLVVFQTDWNSPDYATLGYPGEFNSSKWNREWTLIYEDPQGRVYQRNP
jgi:hypothetical protein